MSEISKERILEWQKIFKEEYGKELSFAEATEAAHNLLGFFELLLACDMKQNPQLYKKRKMKKDKKATREIVDKAAERLAGIFIRQIESNRGLKKKKSIL